MHDAFGRIAHLEASVVRFEAPAAKVAELDRELHGSGPDDPGLVTRFVVVQTSLEQLLEDTRWIKRTLLAALIVPIGLIAIALLWRGVFPYQALPDSKDEFKRPPAMTLPQAKPASAAEPVRI